ncbi:hypothetical protein RHMOL_Rhmol08G0004000 [Rhododendron molle]|uniref:Uncharacterized protein n=2 Tax=Rhododendron molle TaxID=49168 RepID=A0ACC0MI12_RHOML|nr:hypothetical protein RHMOL_Rhmol08G0004000 [Rhododendron molle]KAI8540663.1 hypothetical protein RHMOL_Rhmol08G0004000 [Rhododendron molle]
MPNLMHHHRFHIIAGPVQIPSVGHQIIVPVQVEPPVRRSERVAQHPPGAVERRSVAMISSEYPDLYVGAAVRRRLVERDRYDGRPPVEGA